MTKSELLTASQASSWLGVSQSVVTRLSNNGTIPYQTVGARKAYSTEDLEDYLYKANLTQAPPDTPRESQEVPNITAISFFSGAGGLDQGLEKAGIPVQLYCENNRECRMTLSKNRPDAGLIGDINNATKEMVLEFANITPDRGIDLMVGGPPCQAFSTAGARRAFADDRGNIFLKYLELADELQPKYLVIENVRGLLSTPFPLKPDTPPVRGGALSLILEKLKTMQYKVSFNLYNSANFGAAQLRERVILIAKREGSAPPYLQPTHSNDPKWGLQPWVTFNQATKHLRDVRHEHTQFPSKRLALFELLEEGQYWTSLPTDLQESAMGKAYHLSGGRTGFYRRIDGNRPSPTLVTSPTMPATDLCHPTELRPLSVEEYKAIQGFNTDWWIAGSVPEKYKQIGNAVPVKLGQAIGELIKSDMAGAAQAESKLGTSFPFSRYRETSDISWRNPRSHQAPLGQTVA
ncbi:DNA cytosine methyltransferase [Brevibacterium sp. FME17]|uniref:DNA cytosine methyltransferase n=1 Tax=Brevibacterium sp. FME17 TaxID=2742606 RepID=UPI0018660911|nr:DNA cytosine methyltransferase [Brevibacterium sp. FME17]